MDKCSQDSRNHTTVPRWLLGYFQIPIDLNDQEKDNLYLPILKLMKKNEIFRLSRSPFGLWQGSEFDIEIRDKKGAENLAADHLSRLENPHQDKLENKEINEAFPLETLGSVALQDQSDKNLCFWQNLDILKACHSGPTRDTIATYITRRSSIQILLPTIYKMPMTLSPVDFPDVKDSHARYKSQDFTS
ncbi:hypothetical protein Tco_1407502 [Tanacetum coccineum]